MSDTRIDFLYLSEPDMIAAGVTDMAACVDVMEQMFGVLGAGDYVMGGDEGNSHGMAIMFPDEPAFETMPRNGPDRRFMAMPAYLGGDFQMAGVKWYGSNVANRLRGLPRSIHIMVLSHKDTGAPEAIMSGNLLSAFRTGAVPGVGARHLARNDVKVAGLVGPGVMNRTTLDAYMVARPNLEYVKVKGRGFKSIEAFVAATQMKYPQLQVSVVDSIEEAVRDSDLISIATSEDPKGGSGYYPYVNGEWIKPGALFTCPGVIRFDDDFLTRSDVVKAVDSRKLYQTWADEMPYPGYELIGLPGIRFMDMVHEGILERDEIRDLPAIVSGAECGRANDDQIVVFSVGGMPVEDVAWGTHLLRNARRLGVGTSLNLWDTPTLV